MLQVLTQTYKLSGVRAKKILSEQKGSLNAHSPQVNAHVYWRENLWLVVIFWTC